MTKYSIQVFQQDELPPNKPTRFCVYVSTPEGQKDDTRLPREDKEPEPPEEKEVKPLRLWQALGLYDVLYGYNSITVKGRPDVEYHFRRTTVGRLLHYRIYTDHGNPSAWVLYNPSNDDMTKECNIAAFGC